MTNKEKYQRTFSVLHASGNCVREVTTMKKSIRRYIPRAAAVCAVLVLMTALATAAYAADLGGIQRQVQLWMEGEQTDAILTVTDGHYTLEYRDDEGQLRKNYGGGVAFEKDGTQRPVTEAEILEHMNKPEVRYGEDGSVWVYYQEQAVEITDRFDQDGVCHVHLSGGKDVIYLTVFREDGYAYSSHKYPDPNEIA